MSDNHLIEVLFNTKKIIYNTASKRWSYDGVDQDIIIKINPELAKGIAGILYNKVAEYQAEAERKEEKALLARIAKMQEEQATFKAKVEPMIPAGFTAKFDMISKNNYIYNKVQAVAIINDSAINISAEVYYEGTVRDGYHSKKTNMPWVRYFDFKSQRYATLEKAIEKACEAVKEKAESLKKAAEQENKLQTHLNNSKKQLEEAGIKVEKRFRRTDGYKGYEYNEAMIDLGNFFKLTGDVRNGSSPKVIFSNLLITGSFSIDQMKQIAELVKSFK